MSLKASFMLCGEELVDPSFCGFFGLLVELLCGLGTGWEVRIGRGRSSFAFLLSAFLIIL